MIGLLTPTALARTSLALRSAQFVCCLLGMSFVAAGSSVTFHSSNFVLLISYTGMLYTLWYVVAVEIFSFSARLAPRVEQGLDAVLSLMLFIGGLCLATSDQVRYCDLLWHCHNLKAAVAFTFIAMFFFLSSLALSILAATKSPSEPGEVPSQYHLEVTPTDALSPIQDLNSPGNKV